ncbi:MAG: SH3 domain-containing protein [Pseudomonadota bacterium]
MTKSALSVLAALALAMAMAFTMNATTSTPAAAQSIDCAHGPDFYRVRNVRSDDHLNVRARPTHRSARVGAIPYNGVRVRCIGPCKGRWCKVDWFGTVGYVNMRFLGE